MILTVIDYRCRSMYRGGGVRSKSGPSSPEIWIGSGDSLDDVLSGVIGACTSERSIWLLRIMAHGNGAFVQTGSENINQNTCHKFASLRPYFSPGGVGIALHSCGPASRTSIIRGPEGFLERLYAPEDSVTYVPGTLGPGGGPGVDFLRELASKADVPVRGGINSQQFDRHFKYEGPSVLVLPSGAAMVVPPWGRLAADSTKIR